MEKKTQGNIKVRRTLKVLPQTFRMLKEIKREGESWDLLLRTLLEEYKKKNK